MKLCTVDGCDHPARTRGLCPGHYWRLRHGRPLDGPLDTARAKPPRRCVAEGCSRAAESSQGYCHGHDTRIRRGQPVEGPLARKQRQAARCSICGWLAKARGLCSAHYGRWYRHGDALYLVSEHRAVCSTPGCYAVAEARGLCMRCYGHAWRQGTLPARTNRPGRPRKRAA